MFAVLFAMSWAGMLILLAGIWLVVILVRGFVDFAYWLYDVLVVEPRDRKRREELRRQRRSGVANQAERV